MEQNNNSFICKFCGANVEKLKVGSRDHCNKCLKSIHVDFIPGDRANNCKGELEPIEIIFNSKKNQLVYKCKKCKMEIKNIIADDDDYNQIIKITTFK